MKKDLHPQYFADSIITCACGAVIKAGSTKEKQTTDICSKCHPFFTGKANIVDTAGRVDAFRNKISKANSNYAADKKAKEAAKKAAKKTKGVKVEEAK